MYKALSEPRQSRPSGHVFSLLYRKKSFEAVMQRDLLKHEDLVEWEEILSDLFNQHLALIQRRANGHFWDPSDIPTQANKAQLSQS